MKYLAIVFFIVSSLTAQSAFARSSLKFGDTDSLEYIQDIELQGPEGEAMYLGYYFTTKFFIAGVNLTDHGYVAVIKNDDTKSYFTLTDEDIKEFQSQDLLPKPLPSYQISKIDYLMGYSLWIILLGLLIVVGFQKLFKKKEPLEA